MSERGIKKWNAYRSLPEFDVSLNEKRKITNRVDKPMISNDEAEQINEILTNYHGQELKIKYFKNGYIIVELITIKKIDVNNKNIVLNDNRKIAFNNILHLESN